MMNDANEIVSRDLAILEAMAGEMEAYLNSEYTHWTMATGDMPRLTVGGFLMRQQRLSRSTSIRNTHRCQLDLPIAPAGKWPL